MTAAEGGGGAISNKTPSPNRFYFFMRGFIRALNRLVFRWETYGSQNLPRVGGVLVVSNHASHLDPTTVASGLNREVHFLAKEELFTGLFGKFLRRVNAFPLTRAGVKPSTVKECLRLLRDGHVVMIFPEGSRTTTGNLLPALPGAAMLARRAEVPLLPAYISGTFEAMPAGSKMAKPGKVVVRYGKPFLIGQPKPGMARKTFYCQVGPVIMEKIRALAPDSGH